MSKKQSHGSKNDEDSLEHNERDLLADQIPVVPILQLGYTIGATSQNQQGGGYETAEKGFQAPTKVPSAAKARISNHVVGEASRERSQNNDLEGETSHGDVDAQLVVPGRYGTPCGLEGEAHDVEWNEDPVEECGIEAGQLGVEMDDCFGEGDVNRCRVKDWRIGETNYRAKKKNPLLAGKKKSSLTGTFWSPLKWRELPIWTMKPTNEKGLL